MAAPSKSQHIYYYYYHGMWMQQIGAPSRNISSAFFVRSACNFAQKIFQAEIISSKTFFRAPEDLFTYPERAAYEGKV